MLQKQEGDAMFPDGWCQRQPSASRCRATEARRQRQEEYEHRAAKYEERVHCTLHSSLQYIAASTHFVQIHATSGQRKVNWQRASTWQRGPFIHTECSWSPRDIMLQHRMDLVVYTINFQSCTRYCRPSCQRNALFNLGRFQQAFAKRLLAMMRSGYVDDSNMSTSGPPHIIWEWSLT